MKKILFVINTLGRAGAETALLELLRRLDAEEYEISLYVLLGQGEMISQVPQRVHVKNKKICTASVLSGAGRRKLIQTSFLAFFRHGRTIKKMQYVIQNFFRMKKTGNIPAGLKAEETYISQMKKELFGSAGKCSGMCYYMNVLSFCKNNRSGEHIKRRK